MDRKKQRGQRRRLRTIFKDIDQFIPFINTKRVYEHFHVPGNMFGRMFLESNQTSGKIKTEFCRKWIETTEKFISQKPSNLSFCKVVALIDVPYFVDSQIIIFYDEGYYKTFWKRTGPEQFWDLTKQQYSLCKQRNIQTSLKESCWHEKMIDEDDGEVFESDLWFFGELPLEYDGQ